MTNSLFNELRPGSNQSDYLCYKQAARDPRYRSDSEPARRASFELAILYEQNVLRLFVSHLETPQFASTGSLQHRRLRGLGMFPRSEFCDSFRAFGHRGAQIRKSYRAPASLIAVARAAITISATIASRPETLISKLPQRSAKQSGGRTFFGIRHTSP